MILAPHYFIRIADKGVFFLFVLACLFLSLGLWEGLLVAPAEEIQGEAVRIMYVHVPCAWLALGLYVWMAFWSGVFLVWKSILANFLAKACGLIGGLFAFLCIVTGSLWGKPMWGAWWVWDARLTTMFILFILYLGYLLLWHSFENPVKAEKPAAYLALIGVINIPLIKWSVEWWHTLHQPASLKMFKVPSMHSSFLKPLLLMTSGFFLLALSLVILYAQIEILKRRHEVKSKEW